MQSCAVLEEFLNEEYVELEALDLIDVGSSVNKDSMPIDTLLAGCSNYFYIPTNEGTGILKYIVNPDGKALFLIKKSNLPNDIKESLVGGNANTYDDYFSLKDVYGVTSDLKVYYCSEGKESMFGYAYDNLDLDKDREIVGMDSDEETYEYLSRYDKNGDGKVSSREVISLTNMTINSEDPIKDFSDFHNFVNLSEITITDKNFTSFNGLENCRKLSKINLKNVTSGNYEGIGKLGSNLTHLYIQSVTDDEEIKLFSKDIGLGKYDLPKLKYLRNNWRRKLGLPKLYG